MRRTCKNWRISATLGNRKSNRSICGSVKYFVMPMIRKPMASSSSQMIHAHCLNSSSKENHKNSSSTLKHSSPNQASKTKTMHLNKATLLNAANSSWTLRMYSYSDTWDTSFSKKNRFMKWTTYLKMKPSNNFFMTLMKRPSVRSRRAWTARSSIFSFWISLSRKLYRLNLGIPWSLRYTLVNKRLSSIFLIRLISSSYTICWVIRSGSRKRTKTATSISKPKPNKMEKKTRKPQNSCWNAPSSSPLSFAYSPRTHPCSAYSGITHCSGTSKSI